MTYGVFRRERKGRVEHMHRGSGYVKTEAGKLGFCFHKEPAGSGTGEKDSPHSFWRQCALQTPGFQTSVL